MIFDAEVAEAILMEHHRQPRHSGSCERATGRASATNPACGDELSASVRIGGDGEGRIECVKFEVQGCAVSRAGASLVGEALAEAGAEEGRRRLERFLGLMQGELDEGWEEMGNLAALGVVRAMPARLVCATLGARLALQLLATAADERGAGR